MFFSQNGKYEKNLSSKLNKSYLVGSLKNPALKRVEFILERHKQNLTGSSYLLCSNRCDFITPIGGNFYGSSDGCKHPTSFAKCPFCCEVIGAR
jgi:hypothetical protein